MKNPETSISVSSEIFLDISFRVMNYGNDTVCFLNFAPITKPA